METTTQHTGQATNGQSNGSAQRPPPQPYSDVVAEAQTEQQRRADRHREERGALEWTNAPNGADDDHRSPTMFQKPLGDLIVASLCEPVYMLDGADPSDQSYELAFLRTIGREVLALVHAMHPTDAAEGLSQDDITLQLSQVGRRALYGAELLGRRMDALSRGDVDRYWEDDENRREVDVGHAVEVLRENLTAAELGEAGMYELDTGLGHIERWLDGKQEQERARLERIAKAGGTDLEPSAAEQSASPSPAVSDATDDPQDRPGVILECNWDDVCQAYLALRELITAELLGAERFAVFDAALDMASDCLSQLQVDYGPHNGGVKAHQGVRTDG